MPELRRLDRRDWKHVGGAAALLVVAVLLPRTGRIGGTDLLGILKAVVTVACVFAPAVLLGYRRRSLAVAYAVTYAFLTGVYVATGMHTLVLGTPVSDLASMFQLLAFNVARAAVVFTAGYGCGYVLERARRPWLAGA